MFEVAKNYFLKIVIFGIFSLFLYGCGFHLRGWDTTMPKVIKKIYIKYNGNDFYFLNKMGLEINSTGNKLVQKPEEANLILDIKATKFTSKPIGIRNFSSVCLDTYIVKYRLLDNQDCIVLDNQQGVVTQNHVQDSTQQLSSDVQMEQALHQLQSQSAYNITTRIIYDCYEDKSSKKISH